MCVAPHAFHVCALQACMHTNMMFARIDTDNVATWGPPQDCWCEA